MHIMHGGTYRRIGICWAALRVKKIACERWVCCKWGCFWKSSCAMLKQKSYYVSCHYNFLPRSALCLCHAGTAATHSAHIIDNFFSSKLNAFNSYLEILPSAMDGSKQNKFCIKQQKKCKKTLLLTSFDIHSLTETKKKMKKKKINCKKQKQHKRKTGRGNLKDTR